MVLAGACGNDEVLPNDFLNDVPPIDIEDVLDDPEPVEDQFFPPDEVRDPRFFPRVIAHSQKAPRNLGVYSDRLYCVTDTDDGSAVRDIHHLGGHWSNLAVMDTNPASLDVNQAGVYFSDTQNQRVYVSTLVSGKTETLFSSSSLPTIISVDNEKNIFWAGADGTINQTDPNVTGQIPLTVVQQTPIYMTNDATHVYFATAEGMLFRTVKGVANTTAEKLASGEDFVGAIVVDDTHVYWANPFDRAINRVDLKGGSVETFITNVYGPGSVAIDDQYLYFSTRTEGMIKKFAKDSSGGLIVVADNQREPTEIAVGDHFVYWVAQTLGEVWTASK